MRVSEDLTAASSSMISIMVFVAFYKVSFFDERRRFETRLSYPYPTMIDQGRGTKAWIGLSQDLISYKTIDLGIYVHATLIVKERETAELIEVVPIEVHLGDILRTSIVLGELGIIEIEGVDLPDHE